MANQHRPTIQSLKEYLADRSMPEPNSGCLLWLGYADQDGYGIADWRGRRDRAHRLSWTERHGDIPVGMQVCHHCDVSSCINDRHLFLGTNADNVADRTAKGRQSRGPKHAASFLDSEAWRHTRPKGEAHPSAKLTNSQVASIRLDARPQRAVASDYGVSQTTVSLIKRGKIWAASH